MPIRFQSKRFHIHEAALSSQADASYNIVCETTDENIIDTPRNTDKISEEATQAAAAQGV